MWKLIRPALSMLAILTVITGVIYPLVVTGLAQVIFPAQANGTLITADDGTIIGSALIGQANDDPHYFWGRPSAIAYDPLPSGGSNLSLANPVLIDAAAERAAAFRAAHNLPEDAPIPVEMIYASASGLDPHISPEAARLQVDRVAAQRGLDRDVILNLVEQHIEPPQLSFLGQPRVNVLLLNLALDALQ